MRADLYRLIEEPGWQRSLREADPGDDRFEANIDAARQALAYGPYKYSRPLVEDHDAVRIFTTRDDAAGYRVFVGIKVEPPNVRLGWVELEWLE